jgi:hypothetical protein
MGQHNFAAALRMTMPNVVRHYYLRWFELEKCRKDIEAKPQVDREIIDGVMSRV